MKYIYKCYFLFVLLSWPSSYCEDLVIMIDADFSSYSQSSRAIEMGIKTAFSEVNNNIQGRDIVVKPMDHRGNSKRSKRNIKQYLRSKNALVMFAGMHSPPLLRNKTFINQEGVLYLDPWAAAAPITRTTAPKNWIFRLSIDDSKAGAKLVSFLLDMKNLKSPHLILEKTGWGKSNNRNMKKALVAHGISNTSVSWFNWNMNQSDLNQIFLRVEASASDSILFVGNSIEGAKFCKMMAKLDVKRRIPIISHWGITGGNFPVEVGSEVRSKIDLSFLQTNFSFLSPKLTQFQVGVYQRAKKLFPLEFTNPKSIKAPVGFIHAYDISKLLIQALSKVKLEKEIVANRGLVRSSLESLSQPVRGLIKTYVKPFSADSNDKDYHEALSIEDYSMAVYGQDNEVKLIE